MLSRTAVWPFWPCLLLPSLGLSWTPGYSPGAAPSRGFTVDSSDRNEVVSFWQAVYQASEGYPDRMAWNGDYTSVAAGAEGSVSPAFTADVERRLNFIRALCGVPANVRINSGSTVVIAASDSTAPAASTTKGAASQRSAFMISRTFADTGANYALSHDPVSSCVAWTPAAWNANHNGCVAQGFMGPGAINAFFLETAPGLSTWNAAVGHRRWCLMPKATDYATGNSPGSYNPNTGKLVPPSATLYVAQKTEELDTTLAPRFTAYPCPGFFPAPLNSIFWSLSYPGADFSSASVSVTSETGAAVVATVVSRAPGYAENTLVWKMSANASVQQVTGDVKYNVTVTGIGGQGVPTSYSYPVTLIDPNRLDESPALTGSSSPSTEGSTYQVSPVDAAEAIQTGFFLRKTGTWVESATDAANSPVTGNVSPLYSLRVTGANAGHGDNAVFRLTAPVIYDPLLNSIPDQSFEVGREILPGAGAQVQYYYRRGYMGSDNHLALEMSTDGGLSWGMIGSELSGINNKAPETAYTLVTVPIAASSTPVRLRFRYYYTRTDTGRVYSLNESADASGVFIDDITTVGCDELVKTGEATNSPSDSTVEFNATTAGMALTGSQEWWLRERAVLGGHAFPYGPALVAHPVEALTLSGRTDPPAGGSASYSFIPVESADSYTLEVNTLVPAAWTEGAEADPVPQVEDNTAANYDLISTRAGYFSSGARSFRLGLSSSTEIDESFTVSRPFTVSASSSLSFWMRRGAQSATNTISAEVSADGNTWTSVWATAGKTTGDTAGSVQTVSLATFAGKELKVRFAVRKGSTANTAWNATSSGVWFDDIRVVNAWTSALTKDTAVSAASKKVRLDTSTVGEPLQAAVPVRMRLRAVRSGVAGSWGPAFTATPTGTPATGFDGWLIYEFPNLLQGFEGDDDGDGVPNGLEYAFGSDPTVRGLFTQALSLSADRQTLQISHPLDAMRSGVNYGAEWSTDLVNWSSAGVVVQLVDGQLIATAPSGGNAHCYLRWKITQP